MIAHRKSYFGHLFGILDFSGRIYKSSVNLSMFLHYCFCLGEIAGVRNKRNKVACARFSIQNSMNPYTILRWISDLKFIFLYKCLAWVKKLGVEKEGFVFTSCDPERDEHVYQSSVNLRSHIHFFINNYVCLLVWSGWGVDDDSFCSRVAFQNSMNTMSYTNIRWTSDIKCMFLHYCSFGEVAGV